MGGEYGGFEGERISRGRIGQEEEEVKEVKRHDPIGDDGGKNPSPSPSTDVLLGTTSPSWGKIRPAIEEESNAVLVRRQRG